MCTGKSKLCRSRFALAVGLLMVLAAATTGESALAGKRAPFSLSTTSPTAGSTIVGNVSWEVGYKGTAPEKVEFYLDGQLKWTERVAPFRFNGDTGSLDASALSAGSHVLKAVGYLRGYTKGTSITVSVPSAVVPVPSATAPTATSLPTISGTSVVADTLTASTGVWSGAPTSYAYQWQRCDSSGANCQPLAGATAVKYTLAQGDIGQTVRVTVTATNGAGASQPAASAVTALVRADLALSQTTSASSFQNSLYTSDRANDGNSTTRWSSSFTDNQWWQVDLGSLKQVDTVALNWENAYASTYKIQLSSDGSTFTDAATVGNSSAGWKTTTFTAVSARYVRVLGVTRATIYGISFWDAQVFGA